MDTNPAEKPVRHILSLSGGKDSTALAIYMRDRIPDLEYVFCDTEKELPETYEYLEKLEVYLGKPITYLKHDGRGFDELLLMRKGFLPSPQVRWCTELLKIRPYERYLGEDICNSYIGIRADEL
jgi:3'-phosphoadenosine 5'-phosphosulfate sulfotransferase (PAPS reductase)/FAD synthetase